MLNGSFLRRRPWSGFVFIRAAQELTLKMNSIEQMTIKILIILHCYGYNGKTMYE